MGEDAVSTLQQILQFFLASLVVPTENLLGVKSLLLTR